MFLLNGAGQVSKTFATVSSTVHTPRRSFRTLDRSWCVPKMFCPGVFRTDQAGHVSEETYRERTKRTEPTYGDLFYSREGTYFGIAAEAPRNYRVCLGQRMVLIRPNSQSVDFHYLRYWLNSPVMEAHIHGFRDGSVAERLNLPTIRILPVLLPSLPKQRAIAHILGTLDDKIELNRRMNETLEEMARTLFKSWFIDFDPVHAKAALRNHPPNHSSLEGESAQAQATAPVRSGITPPLRGSRQAKGDSPQASRWGDHAAPAPPTPLGRNQTSILPPNPPTRPSPAPKSNQRRRTVVALPEQEAIGRL